MKQRNSHEFRYDISVADFDDGAPILARIIAVKDNGR
jgi:hypothetical protein